MGGWPWVGVDCIKAAMALNLHRFANPGRFLRLASVLLPWLSGGAALLFAVGLYLALIGSPPDYQQGDSARIMYVHVPGAWVAMIGYALLAGAGASALIWRHPLADVASEAIAPVGAAFTFVALASGSLWGKPTWGSYWEWDARLTSFLLLFFLYIGHIALTHAFDDRMRATASTSPLGVLPSRSAASVAGAMRIMPSAMATRCVSALPPTSTMRARPCASRCVRPLMR